MAKNRSSKARGGGKFIKTSPGIIKNPSNSIPNTIFTQVKTSNKSQR